MQIVTNNSEAKMVETMRSIKGEMGGHYALHFHLSLLQEQYQSEFQLRISVNILNDIFRNDEGNILLGKDGDLFVLYFGDDRELLEKAIFQLRYLYVDDPLAHYEDGSENDDFCTMYDLTFQWRPFYRECMERMEMSTQLASEEATGATENVDKQLSPMRLAEIEAELDDIDLGFAIRKQPICAVRKGQAIRPVFHEVYVNIAHLRRLLSHDCELTSKQWLFKYLTENLDRHVLAILIDRPRLYLDRPVSINLNVSSVLSDDFAYFSRKIEEIVRTQIVIEIGVDDVFSDMKAFIEARKRALDRGYRVCLDGLNDASFVQVNRENLGFDLMKMRWNADLEGDLERPKNWKLIEAVEQCGANRIILCRCDSQHAIDYGHALGISLFQGRFPDRMVDPDAVIVN